MYKDITGQRFGKLVCLSWFKNENGRIWWNCQCDCGNKFATAADRLLGAKPVLVGVLGKIQ